jgi:tetratricopeptide (TPR) repeat protein
VFFRPRLRRFRLVAALALRPGVLYIGAMRIFWNWPSLGRVSAVALVTIASQVACRKEPAGGQAATPVPAANESALLAPLPDVSDEEVVLKVVEESQTLLAQGKTAEALGLLRTNAVRHPQNEEIRFNMGFVAAKAGLMNEAMDHYRDAIRLRPDYPDAHNNLGNILMRLRQPQQAVGHLEIAQRLDPTNSATCNNLGSALAASGRIDEAIARFSQAVQINADYAEAWLNLARAYASQKRWKDAEAPAKTALRLNPALPGGTQLLQQVRAEAARN